MDDIEDYFGESQSLKDQGKSRTSHIITLPSGNTGRNPLKIRASLGHGSLSDTVESVWSQSLKDQGKSRTRCH